MSRAGGFQLRAFSHATSPSNSDYPLIKYSAYVPKNPGDSATKRRCYTEHFPWGKSCLSYDAMVYMYISLKWPNDTVDQGVNGVVPMGNEYFKVPQTITIGNSSLIECGSWSTAPTPTGTAAATTSKPNSAGRVDMFFSAVVLAISVILAALSA